MKRLPALLIAAGAALSAPAFAETVTYYLWDPVTRTYVERSVERDATTTVPSVTYSAPASTTTYSTPYVAPSASTYVAPSASTYVAPATVTYHEPVTYGPDIVVTAPRATEDQLITGEVMDRIASDPGISGRVGVETYRNDVTLTGRVATQGQADRVERHARAVDGVDDVTNLVRPRVGGGF